MSERDARAVPDDGTAVNWRQNSSGVTLYEEGNPDAWIHTELEAGVAPEKRLFMVCAECGAVFAQRVKPGRGTTCGDCGTTFEHDDATDVSR